MRMLFLLILLTLIAITTPVQAGWFDKAINKMKSDVVLSKGEINQIDITFEDGFLGSKKAILYNNSSYTITEITLTAPSGRTYILNFSIDLNNEYMNGFEPNTKEERSFDPYPGDRFFWIKSAKGVR